MSAQEIVEEVVETVAPKLVEAESVKTAAGIYLSKGYLGQIAVVAVAAAAGIGYGAYKLGVKHTTAKYELIIEDEIASAKAFYQRLHKQDEDISTPERAVESIMHVPSVPEAADALLRYQGNIEQDDPEEDDSEDDEESEEEVIEVEHVNVFAEHLVADENFDLEAEMENRSPDEPYIVSQEEFLEDDPEFSQVTITYYEGDGTLADEQDQEIPFVDPIVGEENLQRFGHGSGDPRIVYIRNERLSTDFEVLKSDGKYAHEVLGLEHSDGGARARQRRNRQPKFRGEDE